MKIYLLPMGFYDKDLLQCIADRLKAAFGLTVLILDELPLPDSAYSQERKQYDSDTLLKSLNRYIPNDATRALAITNADLYVPMMNFVFGEAVIDGCAALISLYRLRPEFYDHPHDRQLLIDRLAKEAIHELGHTFGLRHSDNPNSVMYFSNNIEDTDRKSGDFDLIERKLIALKIRELRLAL